MGELGWSLNKWKNSTLQEFNLATAGYWRNWERFAAVPMREVAYHVLLSNTLIKASVKPHSVQDYLKLSIDKEKEEPTRPSPEDVQKAQEWAKKLMNGKK